MDSEESSGPVEEADLYKYNQSSLFSDIIMRRPALQSLNSKAKRASDDFITLGESKAASHKADLGSSSVVHDVREYVSVRFLVDTYDSRG